MIPHDKSGGEISWHIFTKWSHENNASPEAFFLQKGCFTIKKDLTQLVLSWLSIIYLLALEMFVNVIDLETAKGIEFITFLQR